MVDPFSITNVFGGVFSSFQKWILPLGIIILLLIILEIAKLIQKRNYEKNLKLLRTNN